MSSQPLKSQQVAGSGRGEAEPMDRAGQVRRRLLALVIPLTALLYVLTEGLNPKGTDQVDDTAADGLKLVVIAGRHPSQLFLSGTLSLLALGAYAVSYGAIASLIRRRGWGVATVAAALGGLAMFCGAIYNVFVGVTLAVVATAHISQDAAAQVLVRGFHSAFGQSFLYVYFAGEVVAPFVMAIALWRSRIVPRWLALLFLVGAEVAEQVASAGFVVVVVLMAPFLVAMALLGIRVWRSAGVARPDPGLLPESA